MAHLFSISRHDGGNNNYGGHKEAVAMPAQFGTIEGVKLSTKGNFTEGEVWAAKVLVSFGAAVVGDTGKVGSSCVKLLSIDRGRGVATFDVVSGFSGKRENSAFQMSWADVKFTGSAGDADGGNNSNNEGGNNQDYQNSGKNGSEGAGNNSGAGNNQDGNNSGANNSTNEGGNNEGANNNPCSDSANNDGANNNQGANNGSEGANNQDNNSVQSLKDKADKAAEAAKDAREMADYCKGKSIDDEARANELEEVAKEKQHKANEAAAACDDDPNNDDLTEKAIEAEADANDAKSKAMRARLQANKSKKQSEEAEADAKQKEEEAEAAQKEYEEAKEEEDNKPIQHKNFNEVLTAVRAGLNVLLVGPSGTGKTTLAQSVAKALGASYHSQGTTYDVSEIKGYNDANGRYVPSVSRQSMEAAVKDSKHYSIMCCEELDSWDKQSGLAACEMIANKTYTFPDGVTLNAPNMVFIACTNTIGRGASVTHSGRDQIDGALINRFHVVTVDYDPQIDLKCAGGDAELVQFGTALRKLAKEAHLPYEFTPRDFARISQLTAAGLSPAVALRGTFGTWVKSDLEGFLMQMDNNNKWMAPAYEALDMLMA